MTDERFTLDTNVLVYSIDRSDKLRRSTAMEIVQLAQFARCRLTLQAVSEFYAAATRKSVVPAQAAMDQALDWLAIFTLRPGLAFRPCGSR